MKKILLLLIVVFAGYIVNAQEYGKLSTLDNNSKSEFKRKIVTEKKERITNLRSNININANNIITKNSNANVIPKNTKSITQFPWEEGFEGTTFPPEGWSMIDNDGDGNNWGLQLVLQDGTTWSDIEGYNSAHAVGSASYRNDVGALNPDNWLITPALELPNGSIELKYWVSAIDVTYSQDHYEVMVSTTGTNVSDFTSIFEETLTTNVWGERIISLNAYSGQTIYIAFVHNESHDVYIMRIDDISIDVGSDIDAQVFSITEPVSGPSLTNSEVVKAIVKNNGIADITGFSLKLEVNGTELATETYTGTIASGEQAEYTFTQTADLSEAKDHIIKVTVILTGDEKEENNSISKTVINYGNVVLMGSVSSVTSCDIRFMDDGAADNYTFTESQIITFHPETTGDMVSITFNELATTTDPLLGTYDALYVFNGVFTMEDLANISESDILGGFAGDYTEELPEPITALNVDGALTVYFEKGTIYFGSPASGWNAEISCITLPNTDLAITNLFPTAALPNQTIAPKVTIKNLGGTAATSWTVEVSDGGSYTSNKNGSSLDLGKSIVIEMDEWTPTANATLTAKVTITGDADLTNNEKTQNVTVKNYENAYTSNVYQSDDYSSINLTNGNLTSVGPNTYDEFPCGEDYNGTSIYRIYTDNSIGTVLPDGSFYNLGMVTGVTEGTLSGLAYDWNNEKWYIGTIISTQVGSANEYYYKLYSLNLSNFTATLIGDQSSQYLLRGLDMASDGFLYAVDLLTSNLVKINPANANITSVGSTGLTLNYGQDVAFDEVEQKLYSIAFDYRSSSDMSSKFGYYNMSTGAFTEIKDYGLDQFGTICITKEPIDLAMVSTTPVDNATGTEVSANVFVTFNKGIIANDLTGITISPDPTGVSASINGSILTIAHNNFDYETTYTVTIPAEAIKDYNSEIKWTFTTETDINVSTENTNVMKVYPNPSNGLVNIQVTENSFVKVADINGRIIETYTVNDNSTITFTQVPGIYLIYVENNGKVYTEKVIIE